MVNVRFEKFEMKYGCYLPEDFKKFMNKYGGDAQFGSCRFEYPENIINNLIRIPGEMDFHLIPFGDVGNGDYYCFYKYGEHSEEYYVGIWLHETSNFVILTSSFKGFIYKCILDDYLSTVIPNEDYTDDENFIFSRECIERSEKLSIDYGFDFEKVKQLKDELDYHEFMVEFDKSAIQSLCYLGYKLIKKKDKRGVDFLDIARKIYRPYVAPNYLLGKALINMDKEGMDFFIQGLRGSLILTGYSYWEEDYLEIPEDVHREMALLADAGLKEVNEFFERKLYNGADPYDFEIRLQMARNYAANNDFSMAMVEYNNAVFCCENKVFTKEILTEALQCATKGGLIFLTGLIEQDIRKLR
jgi:hypothetical protein